jgi:hypothetical protein
MVQPSFSSPRNGVSAEGEKIKDHESFSVDPKKLDRDTKENEHENRTTPPY